MLTAQHTQTHTHGHYSGYVERGEHERAQTGWEDPRSDSPLIALDNAVYVYK